ncbi:M4 family metallopeptidase [Dyadobacter sp. MSC1_007]|jgi:hypothetical protein|uniref:M4 family metallopeptidase n=1 Tax=Dyadobacter sp. MSC1_007 TaxID=2909264 RepID=UPI00202E496E|nr:M4 family metallopeptidase [Dyadobacter sp. MSC1_007]
MKRALFVFTIFALFLKNQFTFSQTLHNAKNVDRTAMSYFDGLQTFRALEYTVNPDPLSDKIYRLQTLPENGFPAIILKGLIQSSLHSFEDKSPYSNVFTDNSTPYTSPEAVQTLVGFEKVMEEYNQRFSWKGIDGIGVAPINVKLENSDETAPSSPIYAAFIKTSNFEVFNFGRSITNSDPFVNVVDIIAHEYSHAILRYKSGIGADKPEVCSEFRTLNEGIADVFGLYIKNRVKKNSPQNYNWIFADQIPTQARDASNPKSIGFADTYNGQNFVNLCSTDYKEHPGGGVLQKWFYLVASGSQGSATNDLGYMYSNLTGIGVEKAIQIVWDAIPFLKVYSDYPAFKSFTLQAAEQLYGLNSPEYIAVQKSWCAVGVCDNNLPIFSLSPANATSGVDPWPGVSIHLSWDNDKRIQEWEVQMSTKYDFSENVQAVKVSSFDALFKPGGGVVYVGEATGYYHPSETVYTRAKITKADADFCKGLNPLCQLFQQFSPTHAFKLDDKKPQFWHGVPTAGFIVNAWNNPSIFWKSVPNAEKFTFQVATDKDFANPVFTGSANYTGNFTESGIVNTALEIDKKYYVRVRAERNNSAKIINNFGAWSKTDSLQTFAPSTSVLQALNQKPNDLPATVSSLGFGVDWYAAPGAVQFLVQVATDDAFSNVIASKVASGNVTATLVTLPAIADQTNLFVRVLPQKGFVYAACTNVWRVKTDKNAMLLAMSGPDPKDPIAYKSYFGKIFKWTANTVDLNLVHHFKVYVKEKTSNLITTFTTPGKALEKEITDQLMFDDQQGIEVSVSAVGPLGAESGLSPSFNYTICADQPFPKFPGDFDQIDPSKNFTITWDPSLWFEPGDQYLVTILSNGVPINGFNNAPTTATSMLVPAGTLGNSKNYSLTIKNSASCPGISAPTVLFSTIAGGNNNPPATPLKDLSIELHAYRNDLDPADPFPFETSDYFLEVELFDPNGDKVQIVDANGNPVSLLQVDSENAVLGMFKKDEPVGKYTLKLKMLDVVGPLLYNLFDPPRFSVILNGQTVINNHIITIDVLNPASPSHEWQDNFQFSDISLDHK